MQLSTYGSAILIFRVSDTIEAVQELINSKAGNLKAASDELMDLHKIQKRRLEAFHLQNHPKYFFHIMDNQLKLIFRSKGRRYTFDHSDLNEQLTLFPLIEFKTIRATLPEGIFRIDYIRGPLTTLDKTEIEDIVGYKWINNPFNHDLVQFSPNKINIRTDNQVIYREFMINEQSRV